MIYEPLSKPKYGSNEGRFLNFILSHMEKWSFYDAHGFNPMMQQFVSLITDTYWQMFLLAYEIDGWRQNSI